mgnify:CR=1 FL=1
MTETSLQAPPRRGVHYRLYDWVMSHANGPHAWWFLGFISFAESSFFPMPPDILLIPMVLADRRRAFWLALWCTATSVVGGLLGYAIGAYLYQSVGHWLIDVYGYGQQIESFREAYKEWGAWIILLKGVTPIPYKLVTIASGIAGYNIWLFVLFSIISRGGRFLIIAGLLYWIGEPVRTFIEKRLGLVLLGFAALVVIGFVIARYVI